VERAISIGAHEHENPPVGAHQHENPPVCAKEALRPLVLADAALAGDSHPLLHDEFLLLVRLELPRTSASGSGLRVEGRGSGVEGFYRV